SRWDGNSGHRCASVGAREGTEAPAAAGSIVLVRDVVDAVREWRGQGKKVALATLYRVAGSSPQPPGAAMAVNEDGEVIGSVSGGCVEGALFEECQRVLAGTPPHSVTYG